MASPKNKRDSLLISFLFYFKNAFPIKRDTLPLGRTPPKMRFSTRQWLIFELERSAFQKTASALGIEKRFSARPPKKRCRTGLSPPNDAMIFFKTTLLSRGGRRGGVV